LELLALIVLLEIISLISFYSLVVDYCGEYKDYCDFLNCLTFVL